MTANATEDLLALFLAHPSVCTDTRSIKPGDVYWALKGERFDGNQFAKAALEAGAAYAVVDDPQVAEAAQDDRIRWVDHSLQSLQNLARAVRQRWSFPVIGLTGSNGKTTTKELIAAALRPKYRVHATAGNFNNHIGVPLTILACPPDAEIAVIEMGTNQPGDILELALIAAPDAGLITNIGHAHIEKLLSLEGVQTEKGQLLEVVKARGGWLFLNADDPRVSAFGEGYARSSSFGRNRGTIRVDIRSQTPEGMVALLHDLQQQLTWEVPTALSGHHNALNLAAAALVAFHFGVDATQLIEGISAYLPTNHRSQLIDRGEYRIWMDAYNANPSSMKATIEHVMSLGASRVALIIGDMYELGKDSETLHRQLGERIEKLAPTLVIGVGKDIRHTLGALSVPHHHFSDAIAAQQHARHLIQGCDLVLLKASRGIGLERLLEVL